MDVEDQFTHAGKIRYRSQTAGHGLLGDWRPILSGEMPLGWGEVDDEESIRAIHAALDRGVTLFDTANVCGAGHSERVLAYAFAGIRSRRKLRHAWVSPKEP